MDFECARPACKNIKKVIWFHFFFEMLFSRDPPLYFCDECSKIENQPTKEEFEEILEYHKPKLE